MKRLAALLAALMIAGCSDPESSRLEPGQTAMLVNEFEGKDNVPVDVENEGTIAIPTGSPVRVALDADASGERTRKVSITLAGEGPNQGKSAKALRFFLRPSK